jgi:putative hydrolase of the HAD superfamily
MPPALSPIDCWIFDLDNTLYPPSARILPLMEVRMALFIEQLLGVDSAEAHRMRHQHFVDHGTTLAGLMKVHTVNPQDYLQFVHDVPMDALEPDPALRDAIARLPGRKLIFTNADAPYAERVLAARGLCGVFDGMHDIIASDLRPKPNMAAYTSFIAQQSVDASRALFVEDMARNLAPAKALGMTTVWLNNGTEHGDAGASADTIDYEIHDLTLWLTNLLEEIPA